MDNLAQFGVVPVDYGVLESVFSDYRSPRHKISELENKGKLIRLKRGLYIVSPGISGKLLSTELIANHLYGPSYVSMESALRYYGLIPEAVQRVFSITTKRSRAFENDVATFDYIACHKDYFPLGVRQIHADGFSFLMASPEKALCDLIVYTSHVRLRFLKTIRVFLEDDIRLDMEAFFKMDIQMFRQIALFSKKKTEINNLIKLMENERI